MKRVDILSRENIEATVGLRGRVRRESCDLETIAALWPIPDGTRQIFRATVDGVAIDLRRKGAKEWE